MNYLLLLWITINPNPVCFTIPFIDHMIAWYGVIFSLSFYLGYKIFIWMYTRFSLQNITIPEEFKDRQIPPSFELTKKQKKLYTFFIKRIDNKESIAKLKLYFFLEQTEKNSITTIESKALSFCESGLLYIIIATIVGSRLGHILFYENIWEFIASPIMIIKTWEGGLASHGGVIAILIASALFIKKKKKISLIAFMDLLCIPTIFVCSWIRIGNFINQEILGGPSTLPWAIIFQNPVDGSPALPRHPIQLYEFFLYASVFCFLFFLWKKNLYKNQSGLYVGYTFTISFIGRFLLEFLKLPQSIYDANFPLQIGQLLSIPMIILGIVLVIRARSKKEALVKKVPDL